MSQRALQFIQQEKEAKTGYLELGYCGLTPDNPQLQDVWDALSELTHLETLILSNKSNEYNKKQKPRSEKKSRNKSDRNLLNKIPIAISNLVNLKKLVISNNRITKLENLPQSISQLYIRSNQISKLENLPQSISQLYISRNQITKLENLPQGISQLYISRNQITKLENLPQSISQLYIRQNQISKLENLPQNISQLDISYNQISKLENLPQSISQFDISNNKINELENLPRSISQIDISNNKINNLSPLIPFAERGLECKIKGNTITHDSEFAKYLIAKEKGTKTGHLDIGYCGLTPDNPQMQDVWNALGELTHLETLVLTNTWNEYSKEQNRWCKRRSQNNGKKNLLDKIPKEIAGLVNLKTLDISGYKKDEWEISKIDHLPDSLTTLNINCNQIKDLKPLLPYVEKGLQFKAILNPIEYPQNSLKPSLKEKKKPKPASSILATADSRPIIRSYKIYGMP